MKLWRAILSPASRFIDKPSGMARGKAGQRVRLSTGRCGNGN